MGCEEIFPGCDLASFGSRSNAVPPEDVLHGLIRQSMAEVGECADDAVIAPARVLSAMRTTKASTSDETEGRPGYCRCLEPSNFWATSLLYQARIVSGLATH